MKAAIFALIILLGIDVGLYHGAHLRRLCDNIVAFGDSIGAWVFSPAD